MPDATITIIETRPCKDEDCAGTAEQEKDGDHTYYVCEVCGFEFDYQRTAQPQTGGTCQMGLEEGTRNAFQALFDQKPSGTPVTLSTKPR